MFFIFVLTHTHMSASIYLYIHISEDTEICANSFLYFQDSRIWEYIYEKLSSKTPFQHFFCPWLLVDQVLLHYNLLFIHSVAVYFAHGKEY